METKITKKQKLLSVNNSWSACDYWLINARVFSDDGAAFWRVKFILCIDRACDLWDPETGEDLDYKEVLENMAWSFLDIVSGPETPEKIAELINACNETIERWNAGARHYI